MLPVAKCTLMYSPIIVKKLFYETRSVPGTTETKYKIKQDIICIDI